MDDLMELAEYAAQSDSMSGGEYRRALWLCRLLTPENEVEANAPNELPSCLELIRAVRFLGHGVHSSYVCYDLAS